MGDICQWGQNGIKLLGSHGNSIMGSSSSAPRAQEETTHERRCSLIEVNQPNESRDEEKEEDLLELEEFACMEDGRGARFEMRVGEKMVCINKSFEKQCWLQAYISNLLKLNKMLGLHVYDELKYNSCDYPFSSELVLEVRGYKALEQTELQKQPLEIKIDLLYFVTSLLSKISNICFTPSDVALSSEGFLLLNFTVAQPSQQNGFIAFVRWAFSSCLSFEECLEGDQMPPKMPIYLQEIYMSVLNSQLSLRELHEQIQTIKEKMNFLMGKTDSFYACSYFKRTVKYAQSSEWIYTKQGHEVFMYNINDKHVCHGKLVRKKKNICVDDRHVIFEPEELELLYIPESAKFMVKANEFEMESCSSISDIEIKYKFPIKWKNPLLCRSRNGDILLLEQYLYRFSPASNKLVQETKKISDYIFLTSNRENSYFIVKTSIDIFRNGIRVYYKDSDIVLLFTGDKKILEEIASVRVDIRTVSFCLEVYKGVFIMLAARNIWILDMNFECFFSFAICTEIKKLAGLANAESKATSTTLFPILNQPFKVDIDLLEDGQNATISENYLHILGKILGQPYYLRYSFVHRMGALKLEGYHPLFVSTPFRLLNIKSPQLKTQKYHFNFHEENSHSYKYSNWIMRGPYFVEVYDVKVQWEKSNYEVFLKIEEIEQTLKSYLQALRASAKKLSHMEMVLLLYKIYKIFEYLHSNSITHRNISVNHLCFTTDKELKIHGWCEPPRNWHMSDFRDFLLTCFNVITYSTYEKLSEKILAKHEAELKAFPIFSDKIHHVFKEGKNIEKAADIEKSLKIFRSSLEKELCTMIEGLDSGKFIFCFEFNTPRFNLLDLQTQKIKKLTVVPDESMRDEFIFQESDSFAWDEAKSRLYIFTASHQFFEATIDVTHMGEDKIVLEDYEYLPNSIRCSAFFISPQGNIFSFGGLKKDSRGRTSFCLSVYLFNWATLTWEVVAELPEPRINSKVIISACSNFVFVIGGLLEHEYAYFRPICFDLATHKCRLLVDKSLPHPLSNVKPSVGSKLIHISMELQLFMVFYIDEGEYVIKYFSCTNSGLSVEIRVKNYSSENNMPKESIAVRGSEVYLLRTYGKLTKIQIHKLESATTKNETIYAI